MKIYLIILIFTQMLFISCFKNEKNNEIENQSNQNIASQKKMTTNANEIIIKTINGNIKITLFQDELPNTTNRINELISIGFYNGLKFFKVIPNYLIQFGDPSETGFGGSGKKLLNETIEKTVTQGTLCLVRPNGNNSGDSQLIISLTRMKNSQDLYLPIGKVTEGFDILKKIKVSDKIIYIKNK